jgi:hypothetical protein
MKYSFLADHDSFHEAGTGRHVEIFVSREALSRD